MMKMENIVDASVREQALAACSPRWQEASARVSQAAISMLVRPTFGTMPFESNLEAIASPRLGARELAEKLLRSDAASPREQCMHGREWARRLSLDSRRALATAGSTGRKPTRPMGLKKPDWATATTAPDEGSTQQNEGEPVLVLSPGEDLPTLKSPASDSTKSAKSCKSSDSSIGSSKGSMQSTRRLQISVVTDLSSETVSVECSPCDSVQTPMSIGTPSPGTYAPRSPSSIGTPSPGTPTKEDQPGTPKRNVWRRLSFSESSGPQRNLWRRLSLNEKRTHRSNSLKGTPESRFAFSLDGADDNNNFNSSPLARSLPGRGGRSASMRETRRSNLVPRVWVEPTLLHNDAVYEGEWVGKPDGRGVLLTPSFAYMGEWKNGVQHGFGVYICLVSKCRYEGQFFEGAANEYGRLLLLTAGPTYVYGRFNKGKFAFKPSCSYGDRNTAVQAAAKAREVAEAAIVHASAGTKSTFSELMQEMAHWSKGSSSNNGGISTPSMDMLPSVNPGPLTHMITSPQS